MGLFSLVSYIVDLLLFAVFIFPVTLPGTHAWHLAITWGKPAFFSVGVTHPS